MDKTVLGLGETVKYKIKIFDFHDNYHSIIHTIISLIKVSFLFKVPSESLQADSELIFILDSGCFVL